jgi:hypothetical protein
VLQKENNPVLSLSLFSKRKKEKEEWFLEMLSRNQR